MSTETKSTALPATNRLSGLIELCSEYEISMNGYEPPYRLSMQTPLLPPLFNSYYDIKSMEDLENEVEYLSYRLRGIMSLCEEHRIPIKGYVEGILTGISNKEQPEDTIEPSLE